MGPRVLSAASGCVLGAGVAAAGTALDVRGCVASENGAITAQLAHAADAARTDGELERARLTQRGANVRIRAGNVVIVLSQGGDVDRCRRATSESGVTRVPFGHPDAVRVRRAGLVVVRRLDELHVGIGAVNNRRAVARSASPVDTAKGPDPVDVYRRRLVGAVVRACTRDARLLRAAAPRAAGAHDDRQHCDRDRRPRHDETVAPGTRQDVPAKATHRRPKKWASATAERHRAFAGERSVGDARPPPPAEVYLRDASKHC